MKESVIKVLKVKPHEHPEVYMLKNTLEAMQEAVGGYIDILGLDDNVCILLNDEGKLIGLEGNRRIGSDIIVGDFFVITLVPKAAEQPLTTTCFEGGGKLKQKAKIRVFKPKYVTEERAMFLWQTV